MSKRKGGKGNIFAFDLDDDIQFSTYGEESDDDKPWDDSSLTSEGESESDDLSYKNPEFEQKYAALMFINACDEGKLEEVTKRSKQDMELVKRHGQEAIENAYKNDHIHVVNWLIEQNPELQKVVDKHAAYLITKGYREKTNLTLKEVAFALSAQSQKTPSFYAPALGIGEFGAFMEVFNQRALSSTPQPFLITFGLPQGHWAAGVLQKDGDKTHLFMYESLATFSHNKNPERNYVVEMLQHIPEHYLNDTLTVYTNNDKMQHADPVNCCMFSWEFAVQVGKQDVRLKGNATGGNFFDYMECHKGNAKPVTIGKKVVNVFESPLPLNLIRSTQSMKHINQRMEMSKEEAGLAVYKNNKTINVTRHTKTHIEQQGEKEVEKIKNKRIEHKRDCLAEMCEQVAGKLTTAGVEAFIEKSTLKGYVEQKELTNPEYFRHPSEIDQLYCRGKSTERK